MSMAKKTKADKKTKSTVNKVSYHYRPDNMTLQDWQIALRRQAAMKEKFVTLIPQHYYKIFFLST